MSYFEWDQALDTGVEAMNDEHKVLIGLMNTVYDKNAGGVPKAELTASIQAMVDYTLQHFSDEETYMASIGFPGLEGHKRLHQNLLDDLGRLFEAFKTGSDKQLGHDFMVFLKTWLTIHIRGIDTKYGDHAKAG